MTMGVQPIQVRHDAYNERVLLRDDAIYEIMNMYAPHAYDLRGRTRCICIRLVSLMGNGYFMWFH